MASIVCLNLKACNIKVFFFYTSPYITFTGGKVIFDEKDIELNAKYILITNNGALQVN